MAKTPTSRARALATLEAGDGSSSSACFGVILNINGSLVPVSTADLANAKANGVEFTLQNPVDIGSLNAFKTWVNTTFKVSLPDASSLPSPLDTVVSTIADTEITVQQAHIKVPGSNGPAGVKYTLQVNGKLPSTVQLIPNTTLLGVDGFVFGFTNEGAAS